MYRLILSAIILPFCLILSGLPASYAETPASPESKLQVFPSPKDQQLSIHAGSKIELYFWAHDPKSTVSDSQADGVIKAVGDLPDGAKLTKEFEKEKGERYLLSWTPTKSQAGKEYPIQLVAVEKGAAVVEGTPETIVINVASVESPRALRVATPQFTADSNAIEAPAELTSSVPEISAPAVSPTDPIIIILPEWASITNVVLDTLTDTTAYIKAVINGQPLENYRAFLKIISGPTTGEVEMAETPCLADDVINCANVAGTFQNLQLGSTYQYELEVRDMNNAVRVSSGVMSFTTSSTQIEGLRNSLLRKISDAEVSAQWSVVALNQQLANLNNGSEEIRNQSKDWGNKIKNLFPQMEKVLNHPETSEELKTEIRNYISRMNQFLDPQNTDGLDQKTEKYIVDLNAGTLVYLNGEIAAWNEYLLYLADYRSRTIAAATVEQLQTLNDHFYVRAGSFGPEASSVPLADPRLEAAEYYREGKNLIWKAADADFETIVAGDANSNQTATLIVERSAIQPNELVVLVNDNDPQSLAVANYYQAVRKIPAKNMIHVNIPVNYILTRDNFHAMKAQIDGAIDPNMQGFVVTWTQPWKVGETWSNYGMSITSALALGWNDLYLNDSPAVCISTPFVNYFDSASTKPFVDHDIRPAMMLGGYTTQDVFALIDRGALAAQNFPAGDGYFVRTTDSARSSRWPLFTGAVHDWSPTPFNLTYIDNSNGTGSDYLKDKSNVLFYQTGLRTVYDINTNQYVPGAIGDSLTSYAGILLGNTGHTSALTWLKVGNTASSGTVNEPCNGTAKFPNPNAMMPQYLSGGTVLEAYWKSIQSPGETVFVGDPLARPFGTKATLENGVLNIKTTILKPGVNYALAAGDSKDGPFTVVRSNIAVSKLGFTTLNLTGANKPYYKLADANSFPNDIEILRTELLNKIAAEEATANAALASLNQQLTQLKVNLEISNQKIRDEVKGWETRLKSVVSLLEALVIKFGVTEETKAAIRNYINRVNSFIDPANMNGLKQQTEAYISSVTAGQLAPLNAQIGSWNQYLQELQAYRSKVLAATTLELLKELELTFPIKIEPPVMGIAFMPDPREEAKQLYIEGKKLQYKANQEISKAVLPDPYIVKVTDASAQIEINTDVPDGNRLFLNISNAGRVEMHEACSSCEGGCTIFSGFMDKLKQNTTYQYWVEMIDLQGNIVKKSKILSFATKLTIAPLPDPEVTQLTETAVQVQINTTMPLGNKLILRILNGAQTQMYEILCNCEGCDAYAGNINELKPDTTYQYWVEMADPQGNMIGKSRTLSFTTKLIVAPLGDPEVVRVTETTVHIQMNTTVPSDNKLILQILDGAKAQMYEVLCNCEGCGGYAGDIDALKPNTTYQYWVEMTDPQERVVAKSKTLSFTTDGYIIANSDENRVIEEGLGLNIKLGPKFKAVSLPPNATFDPQGMFYMLPDLGDRSTYAATFSIIDENGNQLMQKKIIIKVIAKNADVIPTHHDQFPNLASNPSTVATRSGNWSDPDIWSKAIVPVDGDTVRIPPGIEVAYDAVSEAELNAIGLNGHLKFMTDRNTKLKVGDLIVFSDGHLEIGSELEPMRENVKADITIIDKPLNVGTPEKPGRDPKQYGTGINVFGKLETYGTPKNLTWVRIAKEIKAGDKEILLSEPVTGWKAGDTVFIPDSRQRPLVGFGTYHQPEQTWEEATIDRVETGKIILTQGVKYEHLGARDTNGVLKFLPHVALLDRNVLIHSEPLDPGNSSDRYCESQELSSVGCKTRGHMLFADRADTDIRYTRFQDLGRTDSFKPLDNTKMNTDGTTHIGTNQIARYSIHWHHCMGPRREGADRYNPEVYQFKFVGNTVDRATKWSVTIHGTSFGLVTDNVIYRGQGAGIVTEEGDEVGNKIMRNMVMRMQGTGRDGRDDIGEPEYKSGNYGNGGSGFWFRRSGNIVRDNVAVDNNYAAFIYTSYYLFSLDELKAKMIITPRFRGANRMNNMMQPDEGDYLLINPNGEFSGNEGYGLTRIGLWLAYLRGNEINGDLIKDVDKNPANGLQPMEPLVLEHSNFWHLDRNGVIAWHTTKITYDHLTFLSDKNAIRDYPTDSNLAYNLGKYENLYTRITNTHIEGFKGGIGVSNVNASQIGDRPEDAETKGELIENCYLKNFINIGLAPAHQQLSVVTIKNTRFETFKIISSQGSEERWWAGGGRVNLPGNPRDGTPITYGPTNILMNLHIADGILPGDNDDSPVNLASRRIVRILNYNGILGDNFEVFFKDQDPSAIIPKTQFVLGDRFSTKFLGAPEEGLTNAQSFQKYGIAVGGTPVPPCASSPRPEIDGITCNLAPGQFTNVPTPALPGFRFMTPWNGAEITPVQGYNPLVFSYVFTEGFPAGLRIFFQLDDRTWIREHGEGDLYFWSVTPGFHTLTGWVANADGTEIPGTRKSVTVHYN